jgi:predicted DNA-binding transcriptional regulator AlpA
MSLTILKTPHHCSGGDGGMVIFSGDLDQAILTRAWGRDEKEAGVPAMSEAKSGGSARQMLTMEQVLQLVPVGRSTMKRLIKNKEFPSAHYITPNKRVWYADEIAEWQQELPAHSPRKRRPK